MKDFNKIRIKLLIGIIFLILSVISFVGGISLFFFGIFSGIYAFFILGPVLLFAGAAFIIGKEEELKSLYKDYLVAYELKKGFTLISYLSKGRFGDAKIKGSELVEMCDSFGAEDYIKAEYEGIRFEQLDFMVQKKVDIPGRYHIHTVYLNLFKGTFLSFSMSKRIDGFIYIYSKGFKRKNSDIIRLERYKSGYEDFDKQFVVYGSDEKTVYGFLNTKAMDRLLSLHTHFKSIAFCIRNNSVYVIYKKQSHDTFDPDSMLKRFSYSKEIEIIRRDIDDMKLIIRSF